MLLAWNGVRWAACLILLTVAIDESVLQARGEAEAELAYLNQKGHIDAVMTDDCDAFLFGARTIIKKYTSVSFTVCHPCLMSFSATVSAQN